MQMCETAFHFLLMENKKNNWCCGGMKVNNMHDFVKKNTTNAAFIGSFFVTIHFVLYNLKRKSVLQFKYYRRKTKTDEVNWTFLLFWQWRRWQFLERRETLWLPYALVLSQDF